MQHASPAQYAIFHPHRLKYVLMKYLAIVTCLLSVAFSSSGHAQISIVPSELLPSLGLTAAVDGSYNADANVALPPHSLRVGRPPLFGPPAPLLCNLTLEGQMSESQLDISSAYSRAGMAVFRVGRGCVTHLRNMGLRVSDIGYAGTLPAQGKEPATGATSPISFLSLASSFQVEDGGLLVLENVVIWSNALQLMYTGLCNAWSYNGYAELNAAGELHLPGVHATSTGLLLHNVIILPAERLQIAASARSASYHLRSRSGVQGNNAGPPAPNTPAPADKSPALVGLLQSGRPLASGARTAVAPCRAAAVSDAVALNAILLEDLLPHQTLHLSLADNVTIEASTWQLVRVVREAGFTLRGDPNQATQIDFGGVAGFLSIAASMEVSKACIVSFYDLVLINLVAWDAPTGLLSSLVSFLPLFLIRREEGKFLGVSYQPQLITTRCTMYVPDAEAICMRNALPALTTFKPSVNQLLYALWMWTAEDYLRSVFNSVHATALGSNPQDGVLIHKLLDHYTYIQLTHTSVYPISSYQGTAPIHPYARRWLLQELLGTEPAERVTLSSLERVRDTISSGAHSYITILQRLTFCTHPNRNRPTQLAMEGPVKAEPTTYIEAEFMRQFLTANPADPAMAASITAAYLNSSVYRAFGPAVISQTANCSVFSMPNPRSIPRSFTQLDMSDYLPVRQDQDIYKLLDARNVSSSTLDLMGLVAELVVPQGIAPTLGRIVLANLAPGGYAYQFNISRMLPVDGWAEAQGPLAAGFANQSLPVWWVQANRSSRTPVLQLYDVVLVVPQEEMGLIHALMQAVAELKHSGVLDAVLAAALRYGSMQLPDVADLSNNRLLGEQVIALSPGQGTLPEPHISLMLSYAAAWEVEASTSTSVRFRRWSYLGVAGEGVSITSNMPSGNNAFKVIAHVDSAKSGLLELVEDIQRFMKLASIKSTPGQLPAISDGPAEQLPPSQPQPSTPNIWSLPVAAAVASVLGVVALITAVHIIVWRRCQRSLHDNEKSEASFDPLEFDSCSSAFIGTGTDDKNVSKLDDAVGSRCSTHTSSMVTGHNLPAKVVSHIQALQVQLISGRKASLPIFDPSSEHRIGTSVTQAPIGKGRFLGPRQRTIQSNSHQQWQPMSPRCPQQATLRCVQALQHTHAQPHKTSLSTGQCESFVPGVRTFLHSPEGSEAVSMDTEMTASPLILGPMLGQGVSSVVHIGTWNMMPVAVKMVVVQDVPEGLPVGLVRAGVTPERLQDILSEVAIATSTCHPNVVACYAYDVQPITPVPSPPAMSSCEQAGGDTLEALNVAGPLQGAVVACAVNGSVTRQMQQDSVQDLTAPSSLNGLQGSTLQPVTDPGNAQQQGAAVHAVHAVTANIHRSKSCMAAAAWNSQGFELSNSRSVATECPPGAVNGSQAIPVTSEPTSATDNSSGQSLPSRADPIGTCSWRLRMVLDYCNGGTLRELIESGRLTLQVAHALSDAPSGAPLGPGVAREVEVLLLAWQVAVGMDYLASLGVIRGGLSASKVLLHSFSRDEALELYKVAGYDAVMLPAALSGCSRFAKIIGFGRAAQQPPGGSRGLYAAPELLHGDVPSKACDIYAFGVLLLELWYGTPAGQIAKVHGGSLLPSADVLHGGLLPDTPSSLSREPSGSGLLTAQLGHTETGMSVSAPFGCSSGSPNKALVVLSPCCKEGREALCTQLKSKHLELCSTVSGTSTGCSDERSCSIAGLTLDTLTADCRSSRHSLPAPLHAMIERCLSTYAPQRPTFAQLHLWLGSLLAQLTVHVQQQQQVQQQQVQVQQQAGSIQAIQFLDSTWSSP